MRVPAKYLETLRKFNNGKNADALANKLNPGTYPISMTVTIEGELKKGESGISETRNISGSANIVRYLLDRINESTYNCLIRDLDEIRKGEFEVKNGQSKFEQRLNDVMPYREIKRSGSTKFDGIVIVEDVDTCETPLTDMTGRPLKGLTLMQGGE